jgi:hypothetical protein
MSLCVVEIVGKYLYLFRQSRKLIYLMYKFRKLLICVFNCVFNFYMQLELWTRLRLRLKPKLWLRLRPKHRLRLRLWLLVLSFRRTWRLSCWTGIWTADTARSCPPSTDRMLDTCVPALCARCCRSTTAGLPSTWIDAVLLFVPSFILLL